MKTTSKSIQSAVEVPVSELQSRPEQLGGANTNTPTQTVVQRSKVLPYVNHEARQNSRSLPSSEVLAHLRRWYPQVYEIAEVVGAWVWVTFPEQPSETVRASLSQIGFHWNNCRKCWQHPCGHFRTDGSQADPREKYGSHFPSDRVAA